MAMTKDESVRQKLSGGAKPSEAGPEMGTTRMFQWDGSRWLPLDHEPGAEASVEDGSTDLGFWPSAVLAAEAVLICGVFSALLYLMTTRSSYQSQYVELLSLLPILLVEKVYRVLEHQARAAREGTRPWILQALSFSLIIALVASVPYIAEQYLRDQLGYITTVKATIFFTILIYLIAGARIAVQRLRHPIWSLIILAAVGAAVVEPLSLASEAAQGIPRTNALLHSEHLGFILSTVYLMVLTLPFAAIGYAIGPLAGAYGTRIPRQQQASIYAQQPISLTRRLLVRFSGPDWLRSGLRLGGLMAALTTVLLWLWLTLDYGRSNVSASELVIAELLLWFAIAIGTGIYFVVRRRSHPIREMSVAGYSGLLILWGTGTVIVAEYRPLTLLLELAAAAVLVGILMGVALAAYGLARLVSRGVRKRSTVRSPDQSLSGVAAEGTDTRESAGEAL
jgi:hypothetical protein